MTVVLQTMAEYAWVAYVLCAAVVILYLWRALAARRERSRALFTVERDTANRRFAQACAMAIIVSLIAVVVFATATFVVPALEASASPLATPTRSAGVDQPTTTAGADSTPAALPTATPTPTRAPVPTRPPPDTPQPTEPDAGETYGTVYVQFGSFAELVSYEVPSVEVTTAQPLVLTLTWEALEGTSPRNYRVFTHLFAEDGDLLGQHDGGPEKPMMVWVTGETVTSPHWIEFQNPSYVGYAYILVGLYDPESGRVLTETGEDIVQLPVLLEIVAP